MQVYALPISVLPVEKIKPLGKVKIN